MPDLDQDGVKASDVAWASPRCMEELGDQPCFPHAPDICAEVLSPSNTKGEIHEKTALCFDAGAKEVWLCDQDGVMSFFLPGDARPSPISGLCPRFPRQVHLP